MSRRRSDGTLRLRLDLVSRPESATLVRSVIRTLAAAAHLDGTLVDDLCTVVSEACNNVVLHAYPGDAPGPLIFSLAITADAVDAVVRDRGSGIRPGAALRPDLAGPKLEAPRDRGLGVGVSMINTLADRTEFQSNPATGTEVRMMFRRPVPAPEGGGRLSLGAWSLAALA